MKILVIGLNYAPDLIGIPKYTTDLCEQLALRGHEIEIVTAPPYYPAWEVPQDYKKGQRKSEILNGVTVHRVPIYVPLEPKATTRLLHLASFAIGALPKAIARAIAWKPDLVFSVAPAFFSAPVALATALSCGAKSWLHIQDFELDAAFELGIMNGGWLRRFGEALERVVLSGFDRVSSISPNMLSHLVSKGVSTDRVYELRNWVDTHEFAPRTSSKTSYRAELNIPEAATVLLYSGNMSAKQGLDVLADALSILNSEDSDIFTILCGDGPYRHELQKLCRDYKGVRLLNLQPASRLPELLSIADIHLLPQRREAADLVLPSKLAGILASGRPSIIMADPETSLAHEVRGAARLVVPGDPVALVGAIKDLVKDGPARLKMGIVAVEKARDVWDREQILIKFESNLANLVS